MTKIQNCHSEPRGDEESRRNKDRALETSTQELGDPHVVSANWRILLRMTWGVKYLRSIRVLIRVNSAVKAQQSKLKHE